MALTRVAPAGIGSTPGTGYVIGDSFLHSRGLNATDGYYTGIVTTQSLRVIGDLEVEGTTTTLDTALTEVDKLEVGANNNTVGVAVTQSGSGYVATFEGGNFGIGNNTPDAPLRVTSSAVSEASQANDIAVFERNDNGYLKVYTPNNKKGGIVFGDPDSPFVGATLYDHSTNKLEFWTGSGPRMYVDSSGNVGIGTDNPNAPLQINHISPKIILEDNDNGADVSIANIGGAAVYSSQSDAVFLTSDTSERFRIASTGNIGIGTDNPVARVDIVTGTGDGTQNEANCLRLRNRGNNGNAMTLQVGVNTAFAGALNQGYAYLQGRFWGGGNNPILLNPKGGNVGIGRTSAHVPLDVNGDTILRTAGHTTQGDLTRKYGFTGPGNTSNPTSYIAGVADQQYWYQGLGLVFGTVRGNDIGNTLGVERMRITSDGLIGIGTANPRYPLEVNSGNLLVSGSAAGNLILEDRGVADGSRPFTVLQSDSGYFNIYRSNRNASKTTTSSALAFSIAPDGKVGINSATPATAFDVAGGAQFKNNGATLKIESVPGNNFTQVQFKNDGGSFYVGRENNSGNWFATGSNYASVLRSDGAYPLIFRINGSNRLHITSSGNLFVAGTGGMNTTQLPNGSTINVNGTSSNDGLSVIRYSTGYGAYGLNIGRSKSNTIGTNAAVTNGNDLGHISFYGADGTDFNMAAQITAQVDGTPSDGTDMPGRLVFKTSSDGSATPTERLRIQSDGKTLIYGSLGAGNLPLGGNAASAGLQIRGTTQYQGIAFGQSASNATIGIDNTKLVYTANANPANLGGGVQSAHEWWSGSSGGGGPSKIAEMNTSGQLYLGGYPLTHTVAGGSNLKLRAGTGAWGISIGMRSSQNDYAYIGFTDMNGTENIGDIFMQRTGTSTGHMVFSTNNGSGGSENRIRIGNSGRVCISPDASFAAESTNIAMTIVSSGGDVGGYPGINIRSTDSGGGTNSMNGMSIVSTDGNWSLYSNAGNIHGLGLFAGNSANSNNAGFYLRSDKKITMGPQTSDRASTTNYCGQAVHIAGGSLGIGALSNFSTHSGQGGRDVRGWYHANAYTGRNGNAYLHLTTNLWGGGSPHGNSEFIMGGFRITSYRYSPAGTAEELIMFHNWSGSMAGYTRTYTGTWDPGSYAYVRGTGFVTLRLTSQNYVGHIIDLIQYNWYPIRDIRVTSANFSNTATL